MLKDTPQGSNPITDPEEDEEEENEGDPEGGYANEERLTRVLALRAPVETRWNSWYYMIERYRRHSVIFTSVQCHLHVSIRLFGTPCITQLEVADGTLGIT